MTGKDNRTAYQHLVRAAATATFVLVLALTGYVSVRVLVHLGPMTMAIIAALLLAALIGR